MRKAPQMPDEFKGEIKRGGGYTKTAPREWTEAELGWVEDLRAQGFTAREIAESIDRSEVSVSIKLKRLSKTATTYNVEHIDDKYQTNIAFLEHIKPTTIFDAYAGSNSFYKDKAAVTSNDKIPDAQTDFHMDALACCCWLYCRNHKFDVVDLDPFGSAFDCFDLAIKMAKKGLVITFGEMGHQRWKRLDYVRSHYGIQTLDEFTLDRLIEEVQKIGRRNKKKLTVFAKKEWRNIGRVWFEVEPLKVTEQWEREDT